MFLELLSNELFLDIFEYFSTIDLLRSFSNLNIRFNHLINAHLQNHSLNFQSCTKKDFDFICHQSFPSITEYITSLRLSDNDETPEQTDLFFSYGLSLSQFSRLQSLSLHQIYSVSSLQLIIEQLPTLVDLIYLYITRYYIVYNEFYDIGIIECLECLSKLTHCYLDIIEDSESCFCTLPIRSSSITYLSIPHLDCTVKQLTDFLQYLPNLYSLQAQITDSSNVQELPVKICSSIKILKLRFQGSIDAFKNFFQSLPNLFKLRIQIKSLCLNGYEWQSLIETYLPYLKILQFKMSSSISSEQQIDDIFNSFCTQFWIEKCQWFVQCYWSSSYKFPSIEIYTLPYMFEDVTYLANHQTKSTYSNSYASNRIRNLYSTSLLFINCSISNIDLTNIRYLYLSNFSDDLFNSSNIKLPRLEVLKIVFFNIIDENKLENFQFLLNQFPFLHTLIYSTWSKENHLSSSLTHPSIRQLDLRSSMIFYNSHHCQNLIQSSLGQQCHILTINVIEQTDIIKLIFHLPNLRVLIVRCSPTYSNKHLIEWLRQTLPSTCTISNSIDSNHGIRIWIR